MNALPLYGPTTASTPRGCQPPCTSGPPESIIRPVSSQPMSTRSSREPVEAVRHQLRPLFDQVVLKELDQDRMRRSGLVVPQGIDEPPPQQGIVLAIGPGLDWWEGAGVDMPVQPGDHVVFPSSAGVWVEIDEERLLVCRVGEILGVLESLESEPSPP